MDHDSDTKYSDATLPQWDNVIEAAGMNDLVDRESIYGLDVSVNVAYWRKANQIHNWFVTNVQRDEDDCGEYYVSREKLSQLLRDCTLAITNKDPNILPPVDGFFFGGTDIDEWYWKDLMNTINQIQPLLDRKDTDSLSFYYQSSW